jgi:hypothetical protein
LGRAADSVALGHESDLMPLRPIFSAAVLTKARAIWQEMVCGGELMWKSVTTARGATDVAV